MAGEGVFEFGADVFGSNLNAFSAVWLAPSEVVVFGDITECVCLDSERCGLSFFFGGAFVGQF